MRRQSRKAQMNLASIRFHREHPEFYDYLVTEALRVRDRGFARFGIGCLFEHARYETSMGSKEPTEFKLNNNHRAWYSRKLMRDYPELKGLFEIRERKSAFRPAYKHEWSKEEAIAGGTH